MFETDQDLKRKESAIKIFVERFEGSFQKLADNDVDYRVYDGKKNLIAYAEIKTIHKNMSSAYPLHIPINKLSKLCDKRLNPVLIWACDDGIIYGKAEKLSGEIRWSPGTAINQDEMTAYFDKQKELRYIRYY